MAEAKKIPKRLYKYRTFSNRTLEMLVNDTLFFADPSGFNDPLDTKPTLDADIDATALAEVYGKLVQQRVSAEMTAAAQTIKYRGPKTTDHISRHSRRRADQLIADIRYNATNTGYEVDNPERFLFGQCVEQELLRRYDKGVFSLAERANCPLMWSHYGDQHKGLCLGYSVPDDTAADLHKMKYGGSRLIQASAVAAMLKGDHGARRKVDEAVLLRKAIDWRYEKEWRLIGPRGQQDSQVELEEVVFGMRCAAPVVYAVVKALEERCRSVKFYEIREQVGRFLLAKRVLDTSELAISYPRRARSIYEAFDELT